MRSSPAKTTVRRLRWLALAGFVALVPKCLVCLLGYAGLGAALGLAGPELCGAPSSPFAPWAVALAAAVLGLATVWTIVRLRRHRSPPASPAGSHLG